MKRLATVWLALGIALSACTAQQQSSASQNAQQLASSARTRRRMLTWRPRRRKARDRRRQLDDVGADIGERRRRYAQGEAHDAAARQAYVAAAKSVSGVTSVRDMLVINPKLQGLREQTTM